jgi:hypothetical protein
LKTAGRWRLNGKYVKTIDTLMERWENLLEEQEANQDE